MLHWPHCETTTTTEEEERSKRGQKPIETKGPKLNPNLLNAICTAYPSKVNALHIFFIDVPFSRRELANFLTVGWPCPGEEGRRRRRRRWQREGNGGEGIRRRRCRFKEGNFFLEIFKWEIGLPARRRAEISPFSIL